MAKNRIAADMYDTSMRRCALEMLSDLKAVSQDLLMNGCSMEVGMVKAAFG
jgi:hypothetical protein